MQAYSLPTRSMPGWSTSEPGTQRAGHTESPCSATNWQQLGGVAADVAGIHLVAHDLALGVHHEASALGHALLLDVDVEDVSQLVRGVGQHRVRQLLDVLGRVVPRLVREMRVARHRVDLAVRFLELVVQRAEVFQLGRAHEREVGRVEEEHAPLPQHVVLRHRFEVVVVERLDGEVVDFLVDHGHGCCSYLRSILAKLLSKANFLINATS